MSVTTLEPGMPDVGLYRGEVMHLRLRPFRHRFVYDVFSVLLDLDRLGELDRRLRLFSVDRPGLVSFWSRDHGARDGSPLRPWIEAQLDAHGLADAAHRVFLLCFPRLFGYVFNPLSVYYCFARDGALRAIVYEVKNTFGGQRPYVLPVDPARPADAAVRHDCAKDFYVSPFIPMAAHYRFKLSPPGERLSIAIHEDVAEGPLLIATLNARHRPLTDGQLIRAVLALPFMTHRVIAGIHWQALKLWLKGARLYPTSKVAGSAAPAGGEPVEVRRAPGHAG